MRRAAWANSATGLRSFMWGSQRMDSQSLHEQKKAFRKRVIDKMSKVTPDEIESQSSSITKQVLKMEEYHAAKSISIFLSMPGKEVSTQDIALDALRNRKAVFVPYIHSGQGPKSKVIDMLQIRDEDDLKSLKSDSWGIPSLDPDSVPGRQNALGGMGTEADASPGLDLIFMPAVAFDRLHHRLGHGKGFYDRYLETYQIAVNLNRPGGKMPKLVGLALLQQLFQTWDKIPVDETDWKVDSIVTPVAII